MGRIVSAIDIGSNTIHMLVAEVEGGAVRRLWDETDWISLGETVARMGTISTSTLERMIKTLNAYKRRAKSEGADSLYIFATEALRLAENAEEVTKKIQESVGVTVEIISSKKEIELGLRGALLDSVGASPYLLVEVGGGSTQIAECESNIIIKDIALPLGTGKLIAKCKIDYPADPSCVQSVQELTYAEIQKLGKWENIKRIVACGGVARGLWRALHPDGERTLMIQELDYLIWAAPRLSVDQLSIRFQVKPKRAATLLLGSIIYKAIIENCNLEQMTISRFGAREGAVLEIVENKITPTPL